MPFAGISCRPLSVSEALSRPELVGASIAIHGILYYGHGYDEGIVCIPKHGDFDGEGFDFTKPSPPSSQVLMVDEPQFHDRLRAAGFPAMAGAAAFNHDAIIFGKLTRKDERTCIGNLMFAILQSKTEPELYKRHYFCAVNFGDTRLPPLPYEGPQLPEIVSPSLEIFPQM